MYTSRSRIWRSAAAMLLALVSMSVVFMSALSMSALSMSVVSAQETPDTALCFAVADRYIDSQGIEQNGKDTLVFLDPRTGNTQSVNGVVPNIETQFIEAIAFRPGGAQLYAADKDRLGTLDLQSGAFTAIGSFGSGLGQQDANPELESQAFTDVDSLSFNPITGEFWGVHHTLNSLDLLFKINPDTGSYIAGVFADPVNNGQQVDYMQIQPIDGMGDISDIAIDPVDGIMYGLMSSGGGPTRLVIIDPANGATTDITFLTRSISGEIIQNADGLGFNNNGALYATTGANPRADANALWVIDKQTAVATYVGAFGDNVSDIEALDCLSNTGQILLENDVNGVDADRVEDAVSVRTGEPITWTYRVRNGSVYDMNNVVIVDDSGTPDDTSDDVTICQIPTLSPGQSNLDVGMTCERVTTAETGQRVHVAKVTAIDPLGNAYQAQNVGYYIGYTGAAIGGRVWRDVNQNSVQDPFEANEGVAGVAVALFDSTDNPIANATTASDGTYLFNELQPGEYYVTFAAPAEFVFALQDQGSNDALDSDVDATGRTANLTLADGEIKNNVDAGIVGAAQPATLQGYVWEDLNGDGIQNDGEPAIVGIAGATVTLYVETFARASNVVSSTITAEDGSYSLTNIEPSENDQQYYLIFTLPQDYNSFTRRDRGESNEQDSDAERNTGKTASFPLRSGEVNGMWDAGMVKSVTIGGQVWHDTNKDGIRDQSEPSMSGLEINLTDTSANVISTTTNIENGSYLFTQDSQGLPLLPGQYQLTIVSLPPGYIATTPNVGSDDSVDSDFVNGTVTPFSLLSGGESRSQDLGVYIDSLSIYLPLVFK